MSPEDRKTGPGSAVAPDAAPTEPSRRRSDAAAVLFEFRVEVASVFGIGHIPWASGTFASAAALPLALMLAWLGPVTYLAATLLAIAVAIWAAHAGEEHFKQKDPHEVVIDEVAGQLVALALVPVSIGVFAAGFFLFRFFDVVKPFPADKFEKIPGGLGIVLDDIIAALYANLVLHAGLRVLSYLYRA